MAQADDARQHLVATKIAEFREDKEISTLEFSPDGSRLATVQWIGSEVHVWQWAGESRIEQRLAIPEGSALYTLQSGLKYSPDGTELAIVHMAQTPDNFGVVRIWNLHTGREIKEITEPGRDGLRSAIEFSIDGKWFLRTYDGRGSNPGDQFFVYDAKSWNLLWSLRTAPFTPVTMARSPNGRFAVLGGSSLNANKTTSELVIVDLQRHSISHRIAGFPPDREIQAVQWSPNSSTIVALVSSGSGDPEEPNIIIFDASTGQRLALAQDASGDIKSVVFTPDGKYLVEGKERMPVAIWNSQHSTLLQELPSQPSRLAVSRDGHYLAVASLLNVSVWKLR
jgi:WD40 repeat protein